ncbi:MAG: hypothetical protein F2718_01740 [Actinobacteria bacterium]|uniref:Unannotated protein n=1 Tax=freshwater metagenome TaxID=449393 RepID=A0A6J6V5U4_9ZZZZ|nr:hypothetical protein [Actinomycetota bacterium]
MRKSSLILLATSAVVLFLSAQSAYAHVGTPYILINTDTFHQKFISGFTAGRDHIGSGVDHLLFLYLLILPIPAYITRRHLRPGKGFLQSVNLTVKTVSAFTVGHATSVALAAFNIISVPDRLIETLIALSIFITAIHTLYPTRNRAIFFIPVLFGLVHGLAFSTMLKHLVVFQSDRVLTLFAFNICIEFSQVILVVATLPSIWLLGHTRWYPTVKNCGAVISLMLAEFWIGERTFSLTNPALPLTQFLTNHIWFIPALLATLALIAYSRLEWRSERRA